jgi:hypothetical protein
MTPKTIENSDDPTNGAQMERRESSWNGASSVHISFQVFFPVELATQEVAEYIQFQRWQNTLGEN